MKHVVSSIMALVAAAAWTHVAAAQVTVDTGSYELPPPLDTSAIPTRNAPVPFKAADVRVLISVDDRRLWVLVHGDTVHSAPVAVASGRDFTFQGQRWRFATPRGQLRVRSKRTDPLWLPPDWHYAEVASTHGLKLRRMPARGVTLKNGYRLLVRDSIVGVLVPGDTTFNPLPVDEHIIFDSTLFIPPTATHNRQLTGELGKYALDMGNGYMLHGTPDKQSIGTDSTHGCIRLSDEDLEWLYQHIPVGAAVYVK